jgi:hypothetical protein
MFHVAADASALIALWTSFRPNGSVAYRRRFHPPRLRAPRLRFRIHLRVYAADAGSVSCRPLPLLKEDEREVAVTLRSHVQAIASSRHNTDYPEELEKCARTIEEILAALGYAPQAQKFIAAGVEVRNIEIVIEPQLPAPWLSKTCVPW